MKVLLAVSGGIDSMTMADGCVCHDFFDRLRFPGGASFGVAHCNFHLRGEESDADALFVASWAADHGLPFHRADFDTVVYCRDHSVSIETGARELRYKWFGEICRTFGYDCVAVAHNANDNAETLFLNLLRGTGLRGIAGMSATDVLPYSDGSISLLRPLLDYTREEIEFMAVSTGLKYRTDSTNSDIRYRRNFIRNEVFPLLEKLTPSFLRVIGRDMRNFSAARDVLDEWTAANMSKVISSDGNVKVPDLLSIKHWNYLLHEILSSRGFNSSVCADVEQLLRDSFILKNGATFSGRTFHGRDCRLVTSNMALLFIGDKCESAVESKVNVIAGEGVWRFGELCHEVTVRDYLENMPVNCPEGTLMFDSDKLLFPFAVRKWREGDWFVPLGMKGRKKLSDFFTDRHMNMVEKSRMEVFAPSEEVCGRVFAVPGLRIDDSLKITASTKKITIIKTFKNEF